MLQDLQNAEDYLHEQQNMTLKKAEGTILQQYYNRMLEKTTLIIFKLQGKERPMQAGW